MHALLTAPPMSTNVPERSECAFSSNADIQWPSINSMIGIIGDLMHMSAAAPVPFTQGKSAETAQKRMHIKRGLPDSTAVGAAIPYPVTP